MKRLPDPVTHNGQKESHSVKVAPGALLISLSLRERAGVRETIMVPTTYILRGGVGTMIVSWPRAV